MKKSSHKVLSFLAELLQFVRLETFLTARLEFDVLKICKSNT